ncbi:hypothetical protein LTR72_008716 [Exophiala xenobiotica]|nr:hypothetical protein LTR72_008716 [Exophiala xenobiotica]KAK5480207.1 hypothetical protein LTR55_007571 [Exophiala xenobiotica]
MPSVLGFEPITLLANYSEVFSLEAGSLATAWVYFSHTLTWNTFWKLSTVILVLLNFKAFPFVYHLRILNGLRFVLRSQRPSQDVGPEQLFQPLITSSKAPLMEIDVFGHKSNSTYFADIDVARVHLITTLFGNGIAKLRGGTTMNGLSGRPHSKFSVALGAVTCTFRKELLPYETYDMWTRVLTWDDKWLYLVTHFVKRRSKIEPRRSSLYPEQNTRSSEKEMEDDGGAMFKTQTTDSTCGPAKAPIAASALSKMVFKNARITIRPQEMLQAANLLPTADLSEEGGPDANAESQDLKLAQAIESERQRGMRMATLLASQTALEDEFNGDIALGRHYDGVGIEGVVATLAQLGKLSPYQLV